MAQVKPRRPFVCIKDSTNTLFIKVQRVSAPQIRVYHHNFAIIYSVITAKKIKNAIFGLFLGSVLCFAQPPAEQVSNWRFVSGVSVGNITPVSLHLGLGYKAIIFSFDGLGAHDGPNDYWCGIHGNLSWTFFRDLPYSIDVGVGGGYQYAEAPNRMHQALNDANGAIYLYPYNFKEVLDISAEIGIHLYGIFTRIGYPIYYIKNHDEPSILWRIGYMMQF